jgi:hypothetical protein
MRNVLKIIEFLAALILPTLISAQNPPQKINANYQFKSAGADSGGMRIPFYGTLPVSPTPVYVAPGALAYQTSDSSLNQWTGTQWIKISVSASNGLTDSLGNIQLGGSLDKQAKINVRGENIFVYGSKNTPSSQSPFMAIGQSTINRNNTNNSFWPALLISDSADFSSNNSTFLTMCTADVAAPNGFMFCNFQGDNDSVQANLRVFTPVVTQSTFALDINGNPNQCGLCSMYDVYFYGDRTGRQGFGPTGSTIAEFHYGPYPGHTIWQIDSNANMMLGGGPTSFDTTSIVKYASPQGQLDMTNNGNPVAILQENPGATNYLRGAVQAGLGTVDPSAIIEGTSTTRGLLPPRMTTAQKLAILSPAEGLIVYDLTLHQGSYFNGTVWVNF